MVEGAALEMLCGETHPGFESLTLRQKNRQSSTEGCRFFIQSGRLGISSTGHNRVVSHRTEGVHSVGLMI